MAGLHIGHLAILRSGPGASIQHAYEVKLLPDPRPSAIGQAAAAAQRSGSGAGVTWWIGSPLAVDHKVPRIIVSLLLLPSRG
jgi:hypothetical protein